MWKRQIITDSLNDEIASARELYDIQKENTGNGKGKYAEYTLLAFKGQIEEAEAVAGSEESEYNDKKEAYEKLKEQRAAFRKAENSDVIEKADAEKLADQKKTEEYTVEIRSGKDLVYTIDGEKISSPRSDESDGQGRGGARIMKRSAEFFRNSPCRGRSFLSIRQGPSEPN